MQTSYCGNNCEECKWKEELNCPGCKEGPGRTIPNGGSCKIAQCCRNEGVEGCPDCPKMDSCMSYRNRAFQHEYRQDQLEAAQYQASEARHEVVDKKIRNRSELHLWLKLIFWAVIISTGATVISKIGFVWVPLITQVVCHGLVTFSLFKLVTYETKYRAALICNLIRFVLYVICVVALLLLKFGNFNLAYIILFFYLVLYVIDIISSYYLFRANAEVLFGIDDALSEKWKKLWIWYIVSLVVMIVGLCMSYLISGIAAIVFLVVSIIEIVYLYQTAEAFSGENYETVSSDED